MTYVMFFLSRSAYATMTELHFYEESLLTSWQDGPNHLLWAVHTVTLQLGRSSLYKMSLARGQSPCHTADGPEEPGGGAAEGTYGCFTERSSQKLPSGSETEASDLNMICSVEERWRDRL